MIPLDFDPRKLDEIGHVFRDYEIAFKPDDIDIEKSVRKDIYTDPFYMPSWYRPFDNEPVLYSDETPEGHVKSSDAVRPFMFNGVTSDNQKPDQIIIKHDPEIPEIPIDKIPIIYEIKKEDVRALIRPKDVILLKRSFNLIFEDAYTRWEQPDGAYKMLLKYLNLNVLESEVLMNGYKPIVSRRDNKIVFLPNIMWAGDFNPYHWQISLRKSTSRISTQLNRLFLLRNYTILDKVKRKFSPERYVENESKKYGHLLNQGFYEYKNGIDYLYTWDMTFPEEISRKLYLEFDITLKKTKEVIRIFINSLTEYLTTSFYLNPKDEKKLRRLLKRIKLGVFVNIHVNSTECPIKAHLHVHFNILNALYDKTENVFIRCKPMPNKDSIKILWKDAVDSVFHPKEKPPTKDGLYDCKLRYIALEDRARLIVRLRYCARKPVNDVFDYYGEWIFFDEIVHKDFSRDCLYYKNRRIVFGYARKLKEYVGEIEKETRCPISGDLADSKRSVSKEVAEKTADFRLTWVREKRMYRIETLPH